MTLCNYALAHLTNGAFAWTPDRQDGIDLGYSGLGSPERSPRPTDPDSRIFIMVSRWIGHHGLSHA